MSTLDFLRNNYLYILTIAGTISTVAILMGRKFFLDGILDNKLSKQCLNKDLSGYYAIITGANRGIGYEITKFMVERGCNVILGCRNKERAEKAISCITEQLKSTNCNIKPGKMRFMEISLDDLKSVDKFITNYKSLNIALHFLINNAAHQTVKYEFTEDKFEKCWQINYLSPFYLTHHLLPLIYESVSKNPNKLYGRIVSVTSKGHIHCTEIPYYHFINTHSLVKNQSEIDKIAHKFNGIEGEYHNTKMGQVLHSIRLQQILNEKINYNDNEQIKIDICCVHPGLVNTEIFRWNEKPYYIQIAITLFSPFLVLMTRTTQKAAQCVVHCILTDRRMPTFVGGGYHSNFRPFTPGYGQKETNKLIATDLNKLYHVTMNVLKLKPLQFAEYK